MPTCVALCCVVQCKKVGLRKTSLFLLYIAPRLMASSLVFLQLHVCLQIKCVCAAAAAACAVNNWCVSFSPNCLDLGMFD